MMKTKGHYSLFESFAFAFRGISYALRHERNLRVHFSAMIYVLFFAVRYYDLSNTQYALILLVIGFVITCEMINTAIEKTIDLKTPVYNGLAKIAKDVAAGAVLVSSVTAVLVSFLLFWDIEIFAVIIGDIAGHFLLWILPLMLTLLWIIWPQKNAIRRKYSK